MPAIIYQKTPGGLFATGERTVSTFPSGLVRVDQTFICPTSSAATHRAALAVGNDMPGGSAPAIDGLKIFPEPQEKKRDNGFTEFIVSAYGRNTTTLKNSINSTVIVDRKIWGFSHKKTTGTIALPINSSYKFSDTGLTLSQYLPTNAFERYDYDYGSSIGFTNIRTKTTTLVHSDGTTSSITLSLMKLSIFASNFWAFWFSDPYIKVTATRFFGSFKEIDFETHSDISFGTFIAPSGS
jgi:hypothetical protein